MLWTFNVACYLLKLEWRKLWKKPSALVFPIGQTKLVSLVGVLFIKVVLWIILLQDITIKGYEHSINAIEKMSVDEKLPRQNQILALSSSLHYFYIRAYCFKPYCCWILDFECFHTASHKYIFAKLYNQIIWNIFNKLQVYIMNISKINFDY